MATTPAPNPRASLLAGLRTGGVRSTSMNVPHTAAPSGSFNVPRFVSHNLGAHYPEEDDEVADLFDQNAIGYARNGNNGRQFQQAPMTAAVDGPYNGFQQQQQQELMRQAALQRAAGNGYGGGDMQAQAAAAQALQMQMMQMEIMRLQALQQQQAQGGQYNNLPRRASQGFVPPATAGPLNTSFDLRSAAASAQARARQAEQLQAQMNSSGEEQVPMTAALGGKFGSRTLNPNATTFRFSGESANDYSKYASQTPSTPSFTTVISGGTSLGLAGNGALSTSIPSASATAVSTPSKSDAATSWRRGGNNNSVLRQPSPNVKVTPPAGERVSPPPAFSAPKSRPQPLTISSSTSHHQPLPTIAVDIARDPVSGAEDDSSTNSGSSPTTPNSAGSLGAPPLSPREEASKRLYEGLGIGRPAPAPVTPITRLTSQPMRQPRGPPSNTDELAPRNFASRIRRQAIGGLGALMDARKRSEVLEIL